MAEPTVPQDRFAADLERARAILGTVANSPTTTDEERERATEAVDDLFHRDQMMRASRLSLAGHLRTWHGTQRSVTPLALMRQWSHDELVGNHEAFHTRMRA